MAKLIVIAGFGPGISHAVAEKFAAQGFTLALVARNAERLAADVKAFEAKGVRAVAFPADLSDPAATKAALERVHAQLGPVTALHWNVYAAHAGDLLTADAADLRAVFDVPVVSLVAAVQAALPDLKTQAGAVLITNGGLGLIDPATDATAVAWGAMGLGVANAAKHKLAGLLAAKLKSDGIYVGEVVVLQPVKGTPWDNGSATLEASTIAARFWELYEKRDTVSVNVG